MTKSDKLILILKKMTGLLSSAQDEEMRLRRIYHLYNQSQEANEMELREIGREILQLYRGGMGSFFDEGLVDGKNDYLLGKLKAELFDAAVEMITQERSAIVTNDTEEDICKNHAQRQR